MRILLSVSIVVAVTGIASGCSASDSGSAVPVISDTVEKAPVRSSPQKRAEDFDPADVAAIRDMRDHWVSAIATGDAAPVDFMFTGDAVFSLPNHAALSGGDSLSARPVFDRFTAELVLDEQSERFVTDGGNPKKMKKLPWVSYYAKYALTLKPKGGGNAIKGNGQFMTRFHRQPDGSLKIVRGPQVGKPAPDFALNLMKGGGEVRLSSLRGKPTVLIFGSYT